ncbi:MAG: RNA degradosome polyphosphate kinase [Acidimicrobiales bacterium]
MNADLEVFIGPGPHFISAANEGKEIELPRFLDRELAWLDFNARVLSRADVPDVPLLERAKFLAIFSQNLDEFFQVRVAGLKDQVAAELSGDAQCGLEPQAQLHAIRCRVEELLAHQDRIFLDEVRPGLAEAGIQLVAWDEIDRDDRRFLADMFDQQIFPVLTPLALDPGHPFPYISNLSLNLGVWVRDPGNHSRRFARVKVPDLLPRFVVLADNSRYVLLEQIISHHLGTLFPGMVIDSHHPFRVTRNGDLTLEEEEADDLLAAVEIEIRRRRFGRAVRLEINDDIDAEMVNLLVQELGLESNDVYQFKGPLDLGGLWSLYSLPRFDLKDPPHKSVTQVRLAGPNDDPVDLFARIREGDILVHHPYDSFTTSVTAFIRQAASDPHVLAIKITLYRTSSSSPIMAALIRAAEKGKQVVALVELKARFDEQANVAWARALEEAGVHVVYGLVGLKTHSKTMLVVRQEPEGLRRYCHVGTGNYNERTARTYEDIGLLTCDPRVGADLSQLFNYLTGFGRQEQFRTLLVAPGPLRPRLLDLIANEVSAPAGRGRIVAKMNSLVDSEVIDALYAASKAGVEIDLIVRGICCLRPGVPGLSENIRVRSIVGRFLEHARVFYFANGKGVGVPAYYLGSADLMPRNLDRRVEVVISVDAPSLQAQLQEMLDINLADDELSWTLHGDGSWSKVATVNHVNTHIRLQEIITSRALHLEQATPRPSPLRVQAGGGVVWREGDSGLVEVLVVHRPRYDDWSFPKGKCETGEPANVCALREVEEETGYLCTLGEELMSIGYDDDRGRPKDVRYWAMTVRSGAFRSNSEVDDHLWLSPDKAGLQLTYDQDREVLWAFLDTSQIH